MALCSNRPDHLADGRIGDRAIPAASRHVMIDDSERQVGPGNPQGAFGELTEGVVRALMDEMPVDPEQRLPVFLRDDDVRVPHLTEQRPRHVHAVFSSRG